MHRGPRRKRLRCLTTCGPSDSGPKAGSPWRGCLQPGVSSWCQWSAGDRQSGEQMPLVTMTRPRLVVVTVFKFIYLFMAMLGLRCCVRAFSSCGERGLLSLQCAGFSLRWLLLLRSTDSRRVGFSSCGAWASVVVARGL